MTKPKQGRNKSQNENINQATEQFLGEKLKIDDMRAEKESKQVYLQPPILPKIIVLPLTHPTINDRIEKRIGTPQ